MLKQHHKIINSLSRIIFGGGALIFIGFKIWSFSKEEEQDWQLTQIWLSESKQGIFILTLTGLIILLLMAINWLIEGYKWKLLISQLTPVKWKIAIHSVLCGIAAGVLTPLRLGSYFGRVVLLEPKHRVKGVILNLLGNIAQFLATLFFGIIGFIVFSLFIKQSFPYPITYALLCGIALIIAIVAIYGFLNIHLFIKYFTYFKFTKKWPIYFKLMQRYGGEKLGVKLLLVSSLRYFAILTQYIILFKLFNFPLNPLLSSSLMMALFLIYHFLPTLNLFELGATKASLFILLYEYLGYLNNNQQITLTLSLVTFLIWSINLLLPSIAGAIILFKSKLYIEK